MKPGEYLVTGGYLQFLSFDGERPATTIFSLDVYKSIPFVGKISINNSGDFTGDFLDKYGEAHINGRTEPKSTISVQLHFEKAYFAKEEVGRIKTAFIYELEISPKNSAENIFMYSGKYFELGADLPIIDLPKERKADAVAQGFCFLILTPMLQTSINIE